MRIHCISQAKSGYLLQETRSKLWAELDGLHSHQWEYYNKEESVKCLDWLRRFDFTGYRLHCRSLQRLISHTPWPANRIITAWVSHLTLPELLPLKAPPTIDRFIHPVYNQHHESHLQRHHYLRRRRAQSRGQLLLQIWTQYAFNHSPARESTLWSSQ